MRKQLAFERRQTHYLGRARGAYPSCMALDSRRRGQHTMGNNIEYSQANFKHPNFDDPRCRLEANFSISCWGTPETTIDGMSHWDSIRNGLPSSRTEFIYNIDDMEVPVEGHAGLRLGDYKLLLGYPGAADGWHRPMNTTQYETYEQIVYLKGDKPVHLFNIREDPTEHHDLAEKMPDMVAKLRARLEEYRKTMVPANFPDPDNSFNPKNFGDAWTPGWC
ncbi:arylsulfatase I-like [Haliotis rubra]|uniref:arylsulfatase I-like n=1 Tax=Haliotis rubra TaxID=36100 RepID=UPI001EE6089B|nr:arylsulfatase I-like [Haliotis rubra]